MRVICVQKRWQHHAGFSGYDKLSDFLPAHVVRRASFTSRSARLIAAAWDRGVGSPPHLFDYHLGDRIAEGKAFWASFARRADIVHVLYGDEQLNLLLKRAALLRGALIATFHLPAARSRERFERQRAQFGRLAGAIVLASSELAAFRGWLGDDKVLFVPHGIDVTRIPVGAGGKSERLNLVFVGLHMRDFEVAHRVMDRCARENLPVDFEVVLRQDRLGFFTGCDNVRRHSNIDDSALLSLYGNADALFLPVTGATANNAVLEALACGTPVISTRVGGIPDYVDASSGWLLPPNDADAAFELVKRVAANREILGAMRQRARARAETFSWDRIAAQILAAYERVRAGESFSGAA
jgi:glycosyltransferase involved in cell wall biosynthesis